MLQPTTLSLRSGRFSVKLWDAGAGPPVLYLHGVLGLPGLPPWLEQLSRRYRVVAPQMPGVGESTGLESLDDFLDLTLFYADLISALDMDRPVVIGHSVGGNIGAELAAVCPSSVGRLVLVAPTGLWDDAHPVTDIFAHTQAEHRQLLWHDAEAALKRGAYTAPKADDERRADFVEWAKAMAAAGKFLWPIPDKGLKKRIDRVRAPTLLVWGASDRVMPLHYAKLFQQRIPGSRVAIIPEAGHAPMLEQPERFVAVVQDFLDTAPGAAPGALRPGAAPRRGPASLEGPGSL